MQIAKRKIRKKYNVAVSPTGRTSIKYKESEQTYKIGVEMLGDRTTYDLVIYSNQISYWDDKLTTENSKEITDDKKRKILNVTIEFLSLINTRAEVV